MALNTQTIATAIAGISLSGLTILDLNEIPVVVAGRQCPILYPAPDGFIGGMALTRNSFGGSDAYWSCTKTIRYIYLQAPIGAMRSLSFSNHTEMISNLDALIELVVELDVSTAFDIVGVGTGAFGAIPDPAGNLFHGFELSISVREKINA
jgi:hypothetical protein